MSQAERERDSSLFQVGAAVFQLARDPLWSQKEALYSGWQRVIIFLSYRWSQYAAIVDIKCFLITFLL